MAPPMLMNILLIDIMVPRDFGTWSRAKQLNAVTAAAANHTCSMLEATATQRLGMKNIDVLLFLIYVFKIGKILEKQLPWFSPLSTAMHFFQHYSLKKS